MPDEPENAPEASVEPKMLSRRAVSQGLLAASLVGIGAAAYAQLDGYDPMARKDLPSPDVPAAMLSQRPPLIAKSKGLVFGSCVGSQFDGSETYRSATLGLSNTMIHGSGLWWVDVQKQPNAPYDFARAERVYAWATKAGRAFRGHAMINWVYNPDWLPGMIDEASPAQAMSILENHVKTMAQHWRGRFIQWKVVNEPISGSVRHSIWYNKLGEEFIDHAFHVARANEPNTPLMVNQDSIEMGDSYEMRQLDQYLELIQRLQTRGVPVGSVGIEGHLKANAPVNQKGMESFMKSLQAMKLPFMITELDVDDRGLPDDPRKRDSGVAAIMRDLLDVALEQPNCEGITVWDVSDHDSWIVRDSGHARRSGGPQRPTLLDVNYKPKAAWETVVDCLQRARGPSPEWRLLPTT